VHFFVNERFLVQFPIANALEFPRGDVGKVIVIALGFAVGRLIFDAEMAATGFFAVKRIAAEQFAEFEEIGNTAGVLERLIQLDAAAWNGDVFPKFFA
jgi:hypothetical protein